MPRRTFRVSSSSLMPARNSSIAGVQVRLADEQKGRSFVQHSLTDGLAGEQVVTEVHWLELGILGSVRRQPAADRPALAVLLVVAVLWNDELRFQRHGAIMPWRHHGGGQQGVEILGLVLAALAVGAVWTADRVGAVVLGAVPSDQHVAVEDPHRLQAGTLVQLGHDIGEHRVEQGRFDRIEHDADLAVTRDLAHAEQGLTVRPAVTCLQMALARQEGRALHEERSKRGEREVGYGIGLSGDNQDGCQRQSGWTPPRGSAEGRA